MRGSGGETTPYEEAQKETKMLQMLIPVLMLGCPQGPDLGKLVAEAKLTLSDAVTRASRETKGGVAVQAELEFEKEHVVWSVDMAVGTQIVEVLLDAKDGKVIETGEEAEDQSAVVRAAKVSLLDAVRAVVGQHAGTPVMARLHLVDGQATATIDLFAGGKTESYRVDAVEEHPATGGRKPGREEDEGEEDEEDEDEGHEVAKHREAPQATEVIAPAAPRPNAVFTASFGEEDGDLGPTGRNPYFVLEPGYTLVLRGDVDGEDKSIVITVLEETRRIGDIVARVVEERETTDGELEEITRDYYAISKKTNNVYYLGEDVDVYTKGKVTSHKGSWLHGKDGAHYGLMMPGSALCGARFQQEVAPGVAMDRAEIESLDGSFECGAGRFEEVLAVIESTPLEKGVERKLYARGVGLLQDDGLKLVRYGVGKPK